jgi:hypothetical integral membrane protein (TIGR02206 family)
MTQVSFWTFLKDQTVYGGGFATFGMEHRLFLACIVLGLYAACVLYRHASGPVRTIFFRIWASVTLGMELLKQIILIATIHPYPEMELPLNLCGLFAFVGVIHAFKPTNSPKGSDLTGELLYCLGLPAALAALLTPDWTRYPVFNYFSLHAFIIHGFLLGTPLLLLAGGWRPNFRNLWKAAICLAAAAIPIALLNNVLHTNYMFLSWPAKGTPLEIFDNWFGFLGSHGYLLGLVLLLITIWIIMYLPWIVADLWKRKKK